MMTTAHPDDENNAMLAYFSHGKGYRTSLVTATHGEGGQNEIGPELFVPLAVLRTEELLAAHRFDGAEQFFTRAIDFGFSFSVEETLEKWGHDEILGDYVRMIRTIRPDVIVGFVFDGDGGGQHHQTSSRLTLEAFRAAADPARFPEQIKEGLRPWQAKKFYYTAGFGGPQPRVSGATACRRVHRVRRRRQSSTLPAERNSIRYWAALTTRLPEKRAACTSARACRSCCRCRRRSAAGFRWRSVRRARVSIARQRPRRRSGASRKGSLRRRRHQPAKLAEFFSRGSSGPWRGTRSRQRGGRRGAQGASVGRRERHRRAARGRPESASRGAPIAGIDEPSRRGEVRNRLSTGAKGAAVCPGIDARNRHSPRCGRA